MNIPELRSHVVTLLRQFHEPDTQKQWLTCQAHLWAVRPSVVLSLLADGRPLPEQPFAISTRPTGQPASETSWDVLDTNLLTSTAVWLVHSNPRPTIGRPMHVMIDALAQLLDDLHAPLPALGESADPAVWETEAAGILLREAIGYTTSDYTSAAFASAIVWRTLGVPQNANGLPVPRAIHDPIDGWRRMLDTLTTAQSAAATVLTALAIEGGGRAVRVHHLSDFRGEAS